MSAGAQAVHDYLRAHRRRRRPSAYELYTAAITLAIAGALLEHVIARVLGAGLESHQTAVAGPAILALGLVASLRFGTWQGPVTFSAPDVVLLLTAPIATVSLVRPKLDHALALGAAAGALLAALAVVLSAGGVAAVGPARAAATVVGIAAVGVLAVSGSWLVQSSRRAVAGVHRGGVLLPAAAAALLIAALGGGSRAVIGWSGPWGWALAALEGRPGWPVAFGLCVIAAAGVGAWARRRTATAGLEGFLVRAQTRAGIGAAAFTLDYRTATLAYRSARPGRPAVWPRIPPPQRASWVVVWRDLVGIARDRARLGWAAVAAVGGVVEVMTHPGRGVPAVLGALALYVAAVLLAEPLRIDVDHPDRGALLLSRPFGPLLVAHCALPVLTLAGMCALAVAGVVVAGAAAPGALALLVLVVPAVTVAVAAASLTARRGGRVDADLLTRLLSSDPAAPTGPIVAVVLLVPWLLVATGSLAAAFVIVGRAAAAGHPALGAGVGAGVIVAAVAAGLIRALRSSRRP